MKTLISMALMAMAIVSFGDQSMQVARAKSQHFAEVQRARAERKILEAERAGRMNSYNMQADIESIYERSEEKKHNLIKSLEVALAEEESRRKAKISAREAEKNKRLVKQLTKESAGLRRKNEHLRKELDKTINELDKTINELAEYRSQSKHLSRQLRNLPKSLGRGESSGPARRRR